MSSHDIMTATASETNLQCPAATSTMKEEPAQKRIRILEEPKKEEKKSPSKSKNNSNNDGEDMSWICGECKEAECLMQPSATEFLICDGKCRRVFHYPCAGFAQVPEGDDEWICKDCASGRHQCAICHEYGQDDEDVFLCNIEKCGSFFHESCLVLQGVEVTYEAVKKPSSYNNSSGASDENELEEAAEAVTVPLFTCPAHSCWSCTQNDMIKKEKEQDKAKLKGAGGKKKKRKKKTVSIFAPKPERRLYRCLYCPIAYHLTCIPPTSRFHELAVLCHEHASTHKLPDLDLSTSLQGKVEDKIEKQIHKLSGLKRARRKFGKDFSAFFPGLKGDRLTSQEIQYKEFVQEQQNDLEMKTTFDDNGGFGFCLPIEMKGEVHSKPPTYKHINGNKYDPSNRPPRLTLKVEKCICEKQCDEHCFNRMTLMECNNSNCNVGEKCGNRPLTKKEYIKCKPKREGGKGWGLIVQDDVPKGKLVQEYVGEVIFEKEKEKRMIEWNKEHPNDPNFYVMALSKDWYLDAREQANMSRFINHSCEPNCKVLTINVKGYKRNGIYSTRDIKAGEFLCYDYKFETNEGDRFICRCGAKKCRGTMQGGSNKPTRAKPPTTWKEAKAQYELDKKLLEELEKKSVISQVDALVPAATTDNEFVAAGPNQHERTVQASYGVFLWRNAKTGANFFSRNSRIDSGQRRAHKTVYTRPAEHTDMLSLLRKNNC